MNNNVDVLVIGGGAAGLNAALVLGRALRSVLVVDGGHPRNERAEHLHGFLSRDGIDPNELLAIGRREIAAYGVELVTGEVASLERSDDGFRAVLVNGDEVAARRIVLATGLTDKLPDIEGLREGFAVDVLHCPYCHGYEVAGRRLAVLGTHPMSTHHASMIRQWSEHLVFFPNEVAVVTDDDRAKLDARGVEVVDEKVLRVERCEGALRGIVTADGTLHEVDAIFAMSEVTPQDAILEAFGPERYDTPFGQFLKTGDFGETSVPGIWAVGNVANPAAQVIVAAAAGGTAGAAVNASLIEEDTERAMLAR